MRTSRRLTVLPCLLASLCAAQPARAGELENLIQDYNGRKPKARAGDPNQRRERAQRELKPVLLRIAKLDTPEALSFLRSELEKESPEFAAACVEPILQTSNEKAVELVLAGFAKRHPTLKLEILVQLQKTKHDLKPFEGLLAGLVQSETHAEVRRELPAVLGKLDTAAAARAMLSGVGGKNPAARAGRKKGEDEGEEFDRRVLAVLKATRNVEIKEWLAGPAFAGAPPARLAILAELAGELKLAEARPELEKCLHSTNERVLERSLDAIVKIGAGPSAGQIREALERGKLSLTFRIQALDVLATNAGEEGVGVVIAAAAGPDPETRAVAMGSLGRVPGANKAACEVILAGLKDPDAIVRSAALRALRPIRHPDMIPALIGLLGAEREERLKVDALQFLAQITHKNMGMVVEDWLKWWEVAEPTFEFPKVGNLQLATAGKAYDLKYFGIEVSSKRLGFLVDASGSMLEPVDVFLNPDPSGPGGKGQEKGGTTAVPGGQEGGDADKGEGEKKPERKGPRGKAKKIDVLKRELARVVAELPRDTHINIVTFAAAFRPWQDTLQPLAGGGREKAVAFVKDIQTASGTNVFDTLEFALKDKRVDTIFLLTDGLPTRGRFTDPPSILREVRAMNRVRGVVINCIAFGEESPLLKDLAKENGGVYRFVNSY